MKKVIITTLILFLISAVFTTIQSVVSSAEATVLVNREVELMEERNQLEGARLQAVSVSDLEEKASSLGFTRPAELVYFGGSTNVASKN